jgi:hypothetical protein
MSKNFFDFYPEQIFSPLSGANSRVFIDVLMSLYHRFFDETADYDEEAVPVSIIKTHIESVLRTAKFWTDENSGSREVVSDTTDIVQKVHYTYMRLLDCGWLKLERQGHKDYVFMTPRVVELLDLLDNVGRELSRHVGGSVLSVYRNLLGITDKNQKTTAPDIVMSLEQAVEDSRSMAKRMRRLAAHLRDLTEKIAEFDDAIKKAEAFFDGFINESSFVDYNEIKKKDHPMRFKADILAMLNDIEFNPVINADVRAAMAADKSIGEQADVKLSESLAKIRGIFINTDNLLDRIDKTHANLVYRFNEALRYRRRAGSDLKERIEDVFSLLRHKPDIESLNVVNQMPEISGISAEHLYKIKRQKRTLDRNNSSQERKVSAVTMMRNRLHRDYLMMMTVNPERLLEWLDETIGSAVFISSKDIAVETPEEFVMFIQSLRLCSGSAFFKDKFSDILNNYTFTISSESDGVSDHDVVRCHEFSIQRLAATRRA